MGLYTHVDFLRMTSTYRLLIKNQDHLIEIYDYLISNFFCSELDESRDQT